MHPASKNETLLKERLESMPMEEYEVLLKQAVAPTNAQAVPEHAEIIKQLSGGVEGGGGDPLSGGKYSSLQSLQSLPLAAEEDPHVVPPHLTTIPSSSSLASLSAAEVPAAEAAPSALPFTYFFNERTVADVLDEAVDIVSGYDAAGAGAAGVGHGYGEPPPLVRPHATYDDEGMFEVIGSFDECLPDDWESIEIVDKPTEADGACAGANVDDEMEDSAVPGGALIVSERLLREVIDDVFDNHRRSQMECTTEELDEEKSGKDSDDELVESAAADMTAILDDLVSKLKLQASSSSAQRNTCGGSSSSSSPQRSLSPIAGPSHAQGYGAGSLASEAHTSSALKGSNSTAQKLCYLLQTFNDKLRLEGLPMTSHSEELAALQAAAKCNRGGRGIGKNKNKRSGGYKVSKAWREEPQQKPKLEFLTPHVSTLSSSNSISNPGTSREARERTLEMSPKWNSVASVVGRSHSDDRRRSASPSESPSNFSPHTSATFPLPSSSRGHGGQGQSHKSLNGGPGKERKSKKSNGLGAKEILIDPSQSTDYHGNKELSDILGYLGEEKSNEPNRKGDKSGRRKDAKKPEPAGGAGHGAKDTLVKSASLDEAHLNSAVKRGGEGDGQSHGHGGQSQGPKSSLSKGSSSSVHLSTPSSSQGQAQVQPTSTQNQPIVVSSTSKPKSGGNKKRVGEEAKEEDGSSSGAIVTVTSGGASNSNSSSTGGGFEVVRKRERKRKPGTGTGSNSGAGSGGGSTRTEREAETFSRGPSGSRGLGFGLSFGKGKGGDKLSLSSLSRRGCAGASAPASDNSADQSEEDEVRSLPAGECTPRPRIPKQCASSGATPQTSYADIAKVPEPPVEKRIAPLIPNLKSHNSHGRQGQGVGGQSQGQGHGQSQSQPSRQASASQLISPPANRHRERNNHKRNTSHNQSSAEVAKKEEKKVLIEDTDEFPSISVSVALPKRPQQPNLNIPPLIPPTQPHPAPITPTHPLALTTPTPQPLLSVQVTPPSAPTTQQQSQPPPLVNGDGRDRDLDHKTEEEGEGERPASAPATASTAAHVADPDAELPVVFLGNKNQKLSIGKSVQGLEFGFRVMENTTYSAEPEPEPIPEVSVKEVFEQEDAKEAADAAAAAAAKERERMPPPPPKTPPYRAQATPQSQGRRQSLPGDRSGERDRNERPHNQNQSQNQPPPFRSPHYYDQNSNNRGPGTPPPRGAPGGAYRARPPFPRRNGGSGYSPQQSQMGQGSSPGAMTNHGTPPPQSVVVSGYAPGPGGYPPHSMSLSLTQQGPSQGHLAQSPLTAMVAGPPPLIYHANSMTPHPLNYTFAAAHNHRLSQAQAQAQAQGQNQVQGQYGGPQPLIQLPMGYPTLPLPLPVSVSGGPCPYPQGQGQLPVQLPQGQGQVPVGVPLPVMPPPMVNAHSQALPLIGFVAGEGQWTYVSPNLSVPTHADEINPWMDRHAGRLYEAEARGDLTFKRL